MDSRELGLGLGLVASRYFLGSEHLHYGYWPEGLEVGIANLPRAQELYCEFLLSHIPDSAKTILDVGCGTGELARRLLDGGHSVDGVSPSSFLTQQARSKMGCRGRIFESTFEALETDSRYDLVMCAESFQYLKLNGFFHKAQGLLNPDGHLLISDVFRRDRASSVSGLRGGHRLIEVYPRAEAAGFKKLQDIDITDQTAPNLDVAQEFLTGFLRPGGELVSGYLEENHPWIFRAIRWKYRKKTAQLEDRYFSGRRNSGNFALDKTYRLLLFQYAGG